MSEWRVVNTDNFGGDWPDESFVDDATFATEAEAQARADELNVDSEAPRYYKVVEMPYELAPGFEP